MTYKDEYEVARLHVSEDFERRISEQFEGNFKVIHHLAPPLLAREKDSRGRPKKIKFGSWIRAAFPLLAKLKVLRGTAFDIFGYHPERKMERELIDWYQEAVLTVLSSTKGSDSNAAAAIFALPQEVKGFGPVKQQAVENAKKKMKDLLASI